MRILRFRFFRVLSSWRYRMNNLKAWRDRLPWMSYAYLLGASVMDNTVGDGRASRNMLQEVWHFGQQDRSASLDRKSVHNLGELPCSPLGRPTQQRAIPVLLEDLTSEPSSGPFAGTGMQVRWCRYLVVPVL